jgi:hypothetical protein
MRHVIFLNAFAVSTAAIATSTVVNLLFRQDYFLNLMFGGNGTFPKPIA